MLQVLVNLIGNAVIFTFKGKIIIRIQNDSSNAGLLHFEIEDTGIGMDDKKLNSIFILFGAYENGAHDETSGMGLGIALTAKLLNYLGPKDNLKIISKPD